MGSPKLMYLAGILTLTVVSGVGAELLARILKWQPAPEASIGSIRYGYTNDGLGDHHPDQRGVYITELQRPYYVTTNSAGFRNHTELAPNSLRILSLGD